MSCFGPPGKQLDLSRQNSLHVSRQSRTDNFLDFQTKTYSWLLYLIDCIVYGPIMVSNIDLQKNMPRTYFPTSWLRDQSAWHFVHSFMVWNIDFQGNMPQTYFPTSWLRDQSVAYRLSPGGLLIGMTNRRCLRHFKQIFWSSFAYPNCLRQLLIVWDS